MHTLVCVHMPPLGAYAHTRVRAWAASRPMHARAPGACVLFGGTAACGGGGQGGEWQSNWADVRVTTPGCPNQGCFFTGSKGLAGVLTLLLATFLLTLTAHHTLPTPNPRAGCKSFCGLKGAK